MAAIHGLIKNGMPKSEFLKQEIGSRECILKQVGGSCFLFSVLNLLAYSPLRPYYLHLIRSLRIDPSRLCADISECDRLLRSLSPHYRDRSADDGGDSLHVLMNVIMKRLFDPGLVLHSPIPFDPVGSKLDDKEKIPDYEAPTDWNFAVVEQSPASIREGVGGGRRRGAVWGLSAALAAVTALAAAAPRPSDQRRG
eukprot:jgi/Tetstr1/463977/TSEL_008782.t1